MFHRILYGPFLTEHDSAICLGDGGNDHLLKLASGVFAKVVSARACLSSNFQRDRALAGFPQCNDHA